MKLKPELEAFRVHTGSYASPPHAFYGAFDMPGPCGMRLHILATDGEDRTCGPNITSWEHVSVSGRRVPNWQEMCFVKDLFWADDEWVVQFHPAKTDYVNFHPHCLHLWRYKHGFPTPDSVMVGPHVR